MGCGGRSAATATRSRRPGASRRRARSWPRGAPDLMLLDVNLPGVSGLEFLRELAAESERAPLVVMVTAYGSERMAVEAIKAGAYDYLSKPFEIDDLRLVVKNALETVGLRRENKRLRQRIELEGTQRGALIGELRVDDARPLDDREGRGDGRDGARARRVGHGQGAGRARAARAQLAPSARLLRRGQLRGAPFGADRVRAVRPRKGRFYGRGSARRRGKFEQADGGTLFLDEIGDMSANVQAKLLRALEERRIERLGGSDSIPVDVRIVSATHRPLEQDIEKGSFRADLFYRLQVVTVEIPALRERREDIPVLAETFARQAAERYGMPAAHARPVGAAPSGRVRLAGQRPRAAQRGRARDDTRRGRRGRPRRTCPTR